MRKGISIEVSARHVHLSQEHVDLLFGEGYALTPDKWLSQPGQFLCKERVDIIGPKKTLERVAILGPIRKQTQVELSKTECFSIGVNAEIRESGDIEGTSPITIATQRAVVEAEKGAIIAKRHIHMTPEDANLYGLKDRDIVGVKVKSNRSLVFGDVVVRVDPSFKLFMHIDTDEANAANISNGEMTKGQLVIE